VLYALNSKDVGKPTSIETFEVEIVKFYSNRAKAWLIETFYITFVVKYNNSVLLTIVL